MARRLRSIPTRFPDTAAASYYRAVSELIRRMHSMTYEAFQRFMAPEAKRYRTESVTEDSALDIILSVLSFAKQRSASLVFTPNTVQQIARNFVNRVEFFNKRNIADQVQRVKGIDPTSNEPWLDSFMRAAVIENVGYIKSIQQQYFDRVESIVLQGVKNGQSIREMATGIKGTSDVSYNRAKFIAVDQTGSITGQLTAKRHQAAGASRFRWSTSHDERVRAEHRKFDGKVYTYKNGAGDRHLTPGRDYRCRCTGTPIYDDEYDVKVDGPTN